VSDHVHEYRATCSWTGSTGVGYDAYDRTHTGSASPADARLTLSSDHAFRGSPSFLNPEQLVVLAASFCQLLSFLAVAARARIDVIGYEDKDDGVMPEDDPPTRITRITLRPRITVRGDADDARLHHLCVVAHNECYVANSLTTEVIVEPTFLRQ